MAVREFTAGYEPVGEQIATGKDGARVIAVMGLGMQVGHLVEAYGGWVAWCTVGKYHPGTCMGWAVDAEQAARMIPWAGEERAVSV